MRAAARDERRFLGEHHIGKLVEVDHRDVSSGLEEGKQAKKLQAMGRVRDPLMPLACAEDAEQWLFPSLTPEAACLGGLRPDAMKKYTRRVGTPVERRLPLAHGSSAGASQPEDTADEELRQILEALDADIRAAVDDVDRSLIQLALAQSPRDRLRSSSNMTRTLIRLRSARTSDGR